MLQPSDIVEQFEQEFSSHPILVQACGRINIIGEHTDYNNGFVLPAAVDKYIYFAMAENGTGECHLHAANLKQQHSFSIQDIQPCDKLWANYLMGIMQQLQKEGVPLEGIDCVFGGNLPIGSGMSSSAALECGFAMGLNQLFRLEKRRVELAQLAQRSSHEFVGIPCGIMDQFASLLGRQGQAIKLDCRSLAYEYVPLALGDCELVLINSNVSHELASSAYSERVSECKEGVQVLQRHYGEVESLRDVTPDMLEEQREELREPVYRRCAYVIRENERLQEAAACLSDGRLERLGELLFETHAGLRDEYEVSCEEIDFLVDFSEGYEGVLGARVMGGGFGGCTINLVHKGRKEAFLSDAVKAYRKKFDIEAVSYAVNAVDGTRVRRPDELV